MNATHQRRFARAMAQAACLTGLVACRGEVHSTGHDAAGVADAGSSAGVDAGKVAGVEAGLDAGVAAGRDAGSAAADAGRDAGVDAGIACTTTLAAGANIGAAVANSDPGDRICLRSGSFPAFTLNNITRNPRVTVVALVSRSATSRFVIQGNSNGITLDGLTLTSGLITGASTRNISVQNSAFTGQMRIDGVTVAAPQLLFDNNTHHGITATTAPNARFHLSYSGVGTGMPVATIRNSVFDGSCSDGIQSGVPIAVLHNQFKNLLVGTCPNDPHTDALQFYGGPFAGTVVRENYFVNNEQVLTAFDGVDNLLVEGNVFDPGTSAPRPCQIELYSDTRSIVRHNTLLSRGNNGLICLDHKPADPVGTGTVIDDNIARGISLGNGSTAASSTNNLLQTGAGGGNLAGAPTYIGGPAPSTWAGFELAVGSLGKGAGTNPAGSDVGATFFGP